MKSLDFQLKIFGFVLVLQMLDCRSHAAALRDARVAQHEQDLRRGRRCGGCRLAAHRPGATRHPTVYCTSNGRLFYRFFTQSRWTSLGVLAEKRGHSFIVQMAALTHRERVPPLSSVHPRRRKRSSLVFSGSGLCRRSSPCTSLTIIPIIVSSHGHRSISWRSLGYPLHESAST